MPQLTPSDRIELLASRCFHYCWRRPRWRILSSVLYCAWKYKYKNIHNTLLIGPIEILLSIFTHIWNGKGWEQIFTWTKTGFARGWCSPSLLTQSHSNRSSLRIMITPSLLLLMSSGLQAFHLTYNPILSGPLPPLVPYYLPLPFYLLQGRTDDELLHEFRHIFLFSFSTKCHPLL